MKETRSEKITVVVTPALLARLKEYAVRNRRSLSAAATILIEDGLAAEQVTS